MELESLAEEVLKQWPKHAQTPMPAVKDMIVKGMKAALGQVIGLTDEIAEDRTLDRDEVLAVLCEKLALLKRT